MHFVVKFHVFRLFTCTKCVREASDYSNCGKILGPMDGPEKRPHVVTGNTPNKPTEKRPREQEVEGVPEERPARRTLAFQEKGSPSQKVSRRILRKAKLVRSPKSPKQLISPQKRKTVAISWDRREEIALVQFIALFGELKKGEWPSFGAQHEYWDRAAEFIQETVKTAHRRSKPSVRRHVLVDLKRKYETVDAAEAAVGLTVEKYVDGSPCESSASPNTDSLNFSPSLAGKLSCLTPTQLMDLIMEGLLLLGPNVNLMQLLLRVFNQVKDLNTLSIVEQLYSWLASKKGLTSNVLGFVQLSLAAMKRLETNNKVNLVIKFCQMLANDRPDKSGPLIPLNRMPFGLMQYCIEFFTCTNVMQIKEPEDFKLWHETMLTEFPERFQRLLAGPMWSGLDPQDIRDPMKARVNVPCTSKTTQQRRNQKSLFTSSTEVQLAAFDELKEANPSGRFWLKLDATDIKEALMESMKGVWNGDVDLGDGKLKELRKEYDDRVNQVGSLAGLESCAELETGLRKWIDELDGDAKFLESGFKEAVEEYRKKFTNPSTAEETLKNANWNVVEFQTLLQQAQLLKQAYEAELSLLNPVVVRPADVRVVKTSLRGMAGDAKSYLRNLFKKKRTAATHVLVLMLSEERRQKKPYALPVRYIPYKSLRDQYVRDFTREVKKHMTERGLSIVGTTTDGEFCSLRSRGETRAIHLWQLIHDAKDSVRRKNRETLLKMLLVIDTAPDGRPIVEMPNSDIPVSVILELDQILASGLSLEDAITNLRGDSVTTAHPTLRASRRVSDA